MQTSAIFVARPHVSLAISQGSIIFFLIEDISVMCLSLVTKYVAYVLMVRSYNFVKIDDFSDNSTIDQEYLFCTYSGEGFDHPNLLCEIYSNTVLKRRSYKWMKLYIDWSTG